MASAAQPPPADPGELALAMSVLGAVSEGILAIDRTGHIQFCNELLKQQFGFTDEMLVNKEPSKLFEYIRDQLKDPEAVRAMVQRSQDEPHETWQWIFEFLDGRVFELNGRRLQRGQEQLGRIVLCRDITAQRKSQEALEESESNLRRVVQEQERLIATIREIGTPVLPIYDRILVLPLIGHIDSSRSAHLMDELLEAIQRHQATVVIIDITGVSLVDTSVANSLIQSTQAAALLGAHCVLVGISAAVARTIVHLGVDLSQVTTRRDLQAGIAFALRHLGFAITVVKQEPDWLEELDLGQSPTQQ